METDVLLFVVGPGEPALVRAITASSGLRVARRCADVTELLAVAAVGRGALAVISASQVGIDREVVDQLRRFGLAVIGLAAGEDSARVGELGLDAVLETTAPPAALVAALLQLRGLSSSASSAAGSTADAQDDTTELPALSAPAPGTEAGTEAGAGVAGGRVITVWGTAGAPGRTTIAASLARLLAERGSTCLIDADTRAPALAPSLGIIEETSGIAAAARAAANGRLDETALDRAMLHVGRIAILTGLTRPDRWREVPGSALSVVLAKCSARFDWTIVDVSGGLPDDDGEAYGPTRDGAKEAALAAADVQVVVGAADPVGVWRLVEMLALAPRRSSTPQIVVVNKSRSAVSGPSPKNAVREALARFAGVGNAIVMADDRNNLDTALLRGVFLQDVAANSPVLAALLEIEAEIVGERARRGGRRTKRSLARVGAGEPAPAPSRVAAMPV